MNRRKKENRENYLRLLDLLNEYPEFFNEGEEGCPDYVVTEIKELGQILFAEEYEFKLSDLSVSEYLQLKEEGHNDSYIAGMKGVSLTTLRNWKNRNNMNKCRKNPLDISTVITLFKEGKTQKEIAEAVNSSQPYICRLLKKEGVTA